MQDLEYIYKTLFQETENNFTQMEECVKHKDTNTNLYFTLWRLKYITTSFHLPHLKEIFIFHQKYLSSSKTFEKYIF